MAAITICSDFGAPKNKVCHCFPCFPSICHEVMGPDAMILVFWMLSFKSTFSLSSFTFIKRLFSSSSLPAIRVVSSAYLGYWYFSWQSRFQLCFIQSSIFHYVLCIYKLNKQGDNIQPWCTPFLIWKIMYSFTHYVKSILSNPTIRALSFLYNSHYFGVCIWLLIANNILLCTFLTTRKF